VHYQDTSLHPDEAVAELITKTLAGKRNAATHWSVRTIPKETGIAKSTVRRLATVRSAAPPYRQLEAFRAISS
jgi:hypothetical protein